MKHYFLIKYIKNDLPAFKCVIVNEDNLNTWQDNYFNRYPEIVNSEIIEISEKDKMIIDYIHYIKRIITEQINQLDTKIFRLSYLS